MSSNEEVVLEREDFFETKKARMGRKESGKICIRLSSKKNIIRFGFLCLSQKLEGSSGVAVNPFLFPKPSFA